MSKMCGQCGKTKDLDQFYMGTNNKPTRVCIECKRENNRIRYTSNPEKYREQARVWREANPDKKWDWHRNNKDRMRQWAKNNPDKIVRSRIKHKYGLSEEEHAELPKYCQICGDTENLHIDHDHITGKVRGVLCRNHNLGLGLFKDDPVMLLRAVDYLLGLLVSEIIIYSEELVNRGLNNVGRPLSSSRRSVKKSKQR